MATFRYRAVGADGTRTIGREDAANEDSLEITLKDRGLLLISAEEQVSQPNKLRFGGSAYRGARVNSDLLAQFANELAVAHGAGVQIIAMLDDMAQNHDHAGFRETVALVSEKVKGGATFSDALRDYPRTFTPLFVALVEAGERTGKLERVLTDLVKFIEWQSEMGALVLQATVYPVSLLTLVVGLVVMLMSFVLPRFMKIFIDLKLTLPMPTRVVMGISDLFTVNGKWVLLATIAFVLAFSWVRKTTKGRRIIDRSKLSIPLFGKLLTKLILSRFTHNLAMMLGSGLDISASLQLCERLMGNVVLADVIGEARQAITRGDSLSGSLARSGFIPPMVLRTLAVGERTGTVETTLERISQHFDRELPKIIKRFFAIMDPLVLVLLGGMVGFIALAIFLPLYGMYEGVK